MRVGEAGSACSDLLWKLLACRVVRQRTKRSWVWAALKESAAQFIKCMVSPIIFFRSALGPFFQPFICRSGEETRGEQKLPANMMSGQEFHNFWYAAQLDESRVSGSNRNYPSKQKTHTNRWICQFQWDLDWIFWYVTCFYLPIYFPQQFFKGWKCVFLQCKTLGPSMPILIIGIIFSDFLNILQSYNSQVLSKIAVLSNRIVSLRKTQVSHPTNNETNLKLSYRFKCKNGIQV